jgi:hypothetical protein
LFADSKAIARGYGPSRRTIQATVIADAVLCTMEQNGGVT